MSDRSRVGADLTGATARIVVALLTFSLAAAVSSCGSGVDEQQSSQRPREVVRSATTEPAPASSEPTTSPPPSSSPTSAPSVASGPTVTVTRVVDGDTIWVSDGSKVRLIGIDTPEIGECGYDESGSLLRQLVDGRQVTLVAGARDDVDRYDRLLRYVDVDGVDANLEMIRSGRAVARYDSRDGYGRHAREDAYIAADASSPDANVCGPPSTLAPSPPIEPAPASPPPAPGGGATDPRFPTCAAAKSAGLGPYRLGIDPEYHWYRDADGDGVVCE